MAPNQVWKSKETKSYILKIVGQNPNGTIKVTFDFGFNPKKTHNYTVDYLNQFYEYAGYDSVWINEWVHTSPVIDPKPVPVKSATDEFFENLTADRVLFGDYTKDEKINIWKDVPQEKA